MGTTEQIQLAILDATSWAAHMAVIEDNCNWLLERTDPPIGALVRASTTARRDLAAEMRGRFEGEAAAWRALLVQRPDLVRPGKTKQAERTLARVRRAAKAP